MVKALTTSRLTFASMDAAGRVSATADEWATRAPVLTPPTKAGACYNLQPSACYNLHCTCVLLWQLPTGGRELMRSWWHASQQLLTNASSAPPEWTCGWGAGFDQLVFNWLARGSGARAP